MKYDEHKSTALLKAACWKEDKPMKILPCLFSALTAAAVSIVVCSSSSADTPASADLTIENHQRLVTVKDYNGKWLFAQVITTPEVKLSSVASGRNSSLSVLQDGTGKTLWSKAYNVSFLNLMFHGEWQDKVAAGWPQLPNDLGVELLKPSFRFNPNRVEIVIGSDDQLLAFRILDKKHRVEITPTKYGFIGKLDESKTVIVLRPPAAPAVAQASTP